jgi:hypothetical protein
VSETFAQELGRLRATRIALRIGLVPLPFAIALLFFVADAACLLGWREEAMVGVTMALVSPFGLWGAPTLLELMSTSCPRCTEPFFARPERVVAALFVHHARCATCALSIHATRPASGQPEPAPSEPDSAGSSPATPRPRR